MNFEPNNGLPDFNEKTKIMIGKLSAKRRIDFLNSITISISQIQQNADVKDKLKESTIYPLEMTQRFEDEKPKQFVYVKFNLSLVDVSKDSRLPFHKLLKVAIEDMEVYGVSKIDDFMDIVDRIEKLGKSGKNIYYSNNVLKGSNSDNKSDSDNNQNNYKQILIGQPIANQDFNFNAVPNPNKNTSNEIDVNSAFLDAVHNLKRLEEEEDIDFDKIIDIAEDKYYDENFGNITNIDMNNQFEFIHPESKKELYRLKNNVVLDEMGYLNEFYKLSTKIINYNSETFFTYTGEHPEAVDKAYSHILAIEIINSFYKCDFHTLSDEILVKMGFVKYDNCYLIPIWALNVIFLNSKGKRLVNAKTGKDYFIDDVPSINTAFIGGCCILGIPRGNF